MNCVGGGDRLRGVQGYKDEEHDIRAKKRITVDQEVIAHRNLSQYFCDKSVSSTTQCSVVGH